MLDTLNTYRKLMQLKKLCISTQLHHNTSTTSSLNWVCGSYIVYWSSTSENLKSSSCMTKLLSLYTYTLQKCLCIYVSYWLGYMHRMHTIFRVSCAGSFTRSPHLPQLQY